MPEYKSPGVYIEEVDRGTKPIEAAGTSMTAFIGITAEASVKLVLRGNNVTYDFPIRRHHRRAGVVTRGLYAQQQHQC